MLTILFLGANPIDSKRLGVAREHSEISHSLYNTRFRNQFHIVSDLAVRADTLQSLLITRNPDIIHFSGHGTKTGELIFEDEYGKPNCVTIHLISELFGILKMNLKCIFLNACYTHDLANHLANYAECVIGNVGLIEDEASIRFSCAFYTALAHGTDLSQAFQLARNQLKMIGMLVEDSLFALYRDENSLTPLINHHNALDETNLIASSQFPLNFRDAKHSTRLEDNLIADLMVPELNGDLLLQTGHLETDTDQSRRALVKQAIGKYLTALRLAENGDVVDRVRLKRKLGACYRKINETDEAMYQLIDGRDEVKLKRPSSPQLYLEYVKIQLEIAYCKLENDQPGDMEVARQIIDEIIALGKHKELLGADSEFSIEMGNAYKLEAILAFDSGNYDNFYDYQNLARQCFMSAGDKINIVDLDLNLQYAKLQLGDYVAPISFFESHSPEEICKLSPSKIPRAYLTWILAYIDAQNSERAIQLAPMALAATEKYSGDVIDRMRLLIIWAEVLKNLAEAHFENDKSQFHYFRAQMIEKIGLSLKRPDGVKSTLSDIKLVRMQQTRLLGECYTISREFDLAEEELQSAEQLLQEIENPLVVWDLQYELSLAQAKLFKAQGQLPNALSKYEEISKMPQCNHFLGRKVTIEIELAELNILIGDTTNAKRYLTSAEINANQNQRTHDIAKISKLNQLLY